MTGRHVMGLTSVVLALTLCVDAQVKDREGVELQAAIKQVIVEGDPKGALERFKKLAQSSKPEIAAEALVRLAACSEALGQSEARAAYERLVRDYPNQTKFVAVARAWLDKHPAASSRDISVERIWTGRNVNLQGRITRDGRYLTFEDWTNGNANLAVRDLNTGSVRLLTRDAADDAFAERPLPSPDGKLIAYRWGETEKNGTIRLIRFDGTGMRILAHDRHEIFLEAWSPDGKYLAATRSAKDDSNQIVLISTADGSVKQLRSFGSRTPHIGGFSPDGRYLVYSLFKTETEDSGVFALAIDTSRDTPLVHGPGGHADPFWSFDGSRVLFTSERSGTPALWSIGIADGRPSGSPVLLRDNIGNMTPMGVTRDGSLYYGTREVQIDAYLADFNPETLSIGKPALVTEGFVGKNLAPELSPDGHYAAFLRRQATGPIVVLRSLDTGKERTLTTVTPSYGMRTLQWFPDGRSLLVSERVGNNRKRFRRVEIESGTDSVLFDGAWGIWTTALSRDGQSLFYSLREAGATEETATLRLIRRRLDTGVEVELHRIVGSPGSGLFGLSVSVDGSQLAFAFNPSYRDPRKFMIIPTAGGEAREIARPRDVAILLHGALSWTPDGRYLLVTSERRGDTEQQLAALSTTGGELRWLPVRMQEISTRMLSADGRRIAFTGSTSKQELWVIRNLLPPPSASR